MKLDRRSLLTAFLTALGIKLWQPSSSQAQIDNDSLIAKAKQRIMRHRTATMRLQVTDPNGQPLEGQIVTVKHLRHLFSFGAAYHQDLSAKVGESDSDRRHRQYFLQLFNAATLTFYWSVYEPQPQQYQDEELLKRIYWLKQNGIATLRGHPLFWNHVPACLPTWLMNREISTQDSYKFMEQTLQHLSAVIFPHLDEVDVFNELVYWERYEHPFTDLMKKEGKLDIVQHFLIAFKELNPQVKAAINDYSTQPLYYELLRTLLRSRGLVPIDIIGQQSHMHEGNWPFAFANEVVNRLTALQKPIVFTELSVLSGQRKENLDYGKTYTDWQSDRLNEAKQADYLENFYRLVYSYPNTNGIYLWSFSDRHAWLGAPTGILHTDGTPKPAFERLDRLINQEWRINGEFVSNKEGWVIIPQAFEGEYLFKVANTVVQNKHTATQPLQLKLIAS